MNAIREENWSARGHSVKRIVDKGRLATSAEVVPLVIIGRKDPVDEIEPQALAENVLVPLANRKENRYWAWWILPHTEREAETFIEGASKSSSSKERADKSAESSGKAIGSELIKARTNESDSEREEGLQRNKRRKPYKERKTE